MIGNIIYRLAFWGLCQGVMVIGSVANMAFRPMRTSPDQAMENIVQDRRNLFGINRFRY